MAKKNQSENESAPKTETVKTDETVKTPSVSYVRKIVTKLFKGFEGAIRIAGTVKRATVKETNFGESTMFEGQFAATAVGSGVAYRAGVIYLPAVAESLLSDALETAQAAFDDDENSSGEFPGVEFKLDLVKVADTSENSKTGYQWEVKPVGDVQQAQDKTLLMLGE